MAFWSDLGSKFWGGIKSYASDPMAWLSALGTGLGVYDIYRRQQAEKDYLRKQADWMRQVQGVANAPLNIEAIFNPGKEILSRDLEAGLAERGLQPGGAWSSAMGEGMMRHWLDAANVARAQRGDQLSAYTGTGPVRPQYAGAGDVSSLGKYLQFVRESKAAEAARRQQGDFQGQLLEIIRTAQSPAGGANGIPGRRQSIDFPGYPDIYGGESFGEGISDLWYDR